MDFFAELVNILEGVTGVMTDTTVYLDGVDFNDTMIFDFMGYARYILGDVNYIAITSMFIIGVGLSIWSFLLKAVGYIKNLLPW